MELENREVLVESHIDDSGHIPEIGGLAIGSAFRNAGKCVGDKLGIPVNFILLQKSGAKKTGKNTGGSPPAT